jgi:hypothetical protein
MESHATYRDPNSTGWIAFLCLFALGGSLAIPVVVLQSAPSNDAPEVDAHQPESQPTHTISQPSQYVALPRFRNEERQLPTKEQLRDPVFRRNYVGPVFLGDSRRNLERRKSIWDLDLEVAEYEQELERERILQEVEAEREANRKRPAPEWKNWDIERELELLRKQTIPNRKGR